MCLWEGVASYTIYGLIPSPVFRLQFLSLAVCKKGGDRFSHVDEVR